MSQITIRTLLDTGGFRAGLQTMRDESQRFRAQFQKGIEQGQGLMGALNRGMGTLASGRLAGPIAAVAAGLAGAAAAAGLISRHFDAVRDATARSARNVEAMRDAMNAQAAARVSGESANVDLERQLASARAEESDLLGDPRRLRDPRQFASIIPNARAMSDSFGGFLRNAAAGLLGSTVGQIPLVGALVSGATDAQQEEFARQQEALMQAQARRRDLESRRAAARLTNDLTQMSAVEQMEQARERRRVQTGDLLPADATANQIERENRRLQRMREFYRDDNNPAVLQQRARIVSLGAQMEQELSQQFRYRNDPTIIADQMARVGGGGGVGVFGDGQGQLLVEQRRMAALADRTNQILVEIREQLVRTGGGDVAP